MNCHMSTCVHKSGYRKTINPPLLTSLAERSKELIYLSWSGVAWVRIPLETCIFILNFSLPPRSEQSSGAHANKIKHDHSPVVICVLDPRYKAVYTYSRSIAFITISFLKAGHPFEIVKQEKGLIQTFAFDEYDKPFMYCSEQFVIPKRSSDRPMGSPCSIFGT